MGPEITEEWMVQRFTQSHPYASVLLTSEQLGDSSMEMQLLISFPPRPSLRHDGSVRFAPPFRTAAASAAAAAAAAWCTSRVVVGRLPRTGARPGARDREKMHSSSAEGLQGGGGNEMVYEGLYCRQERPPQTLKP